MAIYRAMLEDSINDLDTNNDGAKETKELMDVILLWLSLSLILAIMLSLRV